MEFVLSLFLNCVGYLFKPAMNLFRVLKVNVQLIECRLDKSSKPDGEGGFTNGSRAHFMIEIINRKDKKFIISKLHCSAMCQGKILQDNICCYNKDTYKKLALQPTYEPLSTLDVLPQSSVQYEVIITPGGDLTQCDKLLFSYSKGIKRRKIVIWEKEQI